MDAIWYPGVADPNNPENGDCDFQPSPSLRQ